MHYSIVIFGLLNLLIFCFLTRKIQLGKKMSIGLIVLLIMLVIFHFLELLPNPVSDYHFYLLLFFSLTLFIFHFGGEIVIWILKKVRPDLKNHSVFSVFNFLRFYVVYVLIYVYQCISLLYGKF